MTKSRLKYVQLLFIITAFLTIQWTTTHVHFSKHHNHDGSLHKHHVETHAHQYIAINNSSLELSHSNIIELDTEYNFKHRKKQKASSSPDVAISTSNNILSISLIKLELPVFINTEQGYSPYSSTNPRGPPLNS